MPVFKPGEFGLIMARNRPEHLTADLAILHAGGIPVSLYNTLAPGQVEYIARAGSSRVQRMRSSIRSADR